jgi:tRNA1Val (adenine37-N6)-methyltransferase
MEGLYLQKHTNLSVFRFKHFEVRQEKNPLKVGTDSMLLGALIDASMHERALDLGAGTGVLSLMIAQKNPNILIDAIEINPEGAQECVENFVNSPWKERLQVFQGDYLKFQFQGKYDLIFSNPPYYTNTLLTLDKDLNQAKHSDQNTILHFFKLVNLILSLNGKLWIIIPYLSFSFFTEFARQNNLYPSRIIHIHSKATKPNTRVVVCFQRNEDQAEEKYEIVIRDDSNKYSLEYKSLTRDFHWDFFD